MATFLIDGHTIPEELQILASSGNQPFVASLHPGVSHVLGVRIPDLRVLAKRIVKLNWEDYLSSAGTYYMEERILQGLVLGYIHPDDNIEVYLQRVSHFVHIINSWSVCDTFSFAGGKSFVSKHSERIWSYLKQWMLSSKEYEIRFGVVMSLKYFVDEAHMNDLFNCLDRISHEGYYVKMAVAWAVSVCFVNDPILTMNYLRHNKLDNFTYNKSLQKIIESYRVDVSVKQIIKSMKRK